MASRKIVFIHGAHVNALCWEKFIPFFEARGYQCEAPNWPHDDRPVAELRASPAAELGRLGVVEIVDHHAALITRMSPAPILVGHSFGGLFVQMLLDRGLGAAGVALDPAPTRGVIPNAAAFASNLGPLAARFSGKRLVLMSKSDFGRFFANGIPDAERDEAYQRYVIPTPTSIFIQAATAPFHKATAVNYKKQVRAPLLITAGGNDHQVPASLNRANYRFYQNTPQARVELKQFPGRSHTLILEPGWEEVAEYCAEWISHQKT